MLTFLKSKIWSVGMLLLVFNWPLSAQNDGSESNPNNPEPACTVDVIDFVMSL